MRSIVRRIEGLEKRLMPQRPTEFDRALTARIKAARERLRRLREAGILPPPPSDEGLPPKKVHKSRGLQLTIDILNEGRNRARLRAIRDGVLLEKGQPKGGA